MPQLKTTGIAAVNVVVPLTLPEPVGELFVNSAPENSASPVTVPLLYE